MDLLYPHQPHLQVIIQLPLPLLQVTLQQQQVLFQQMIIMDHLFPHQFHRHHHPTVLVLLLILQQQQLEEVMTTGHQ